MSKPGRGLPRGYVQRNGRGLFRPDELVNRQAHATIADLRRLKGEVYRRRGEIQDWANRLNLTWFAAAIWLLTVSLPRPRGRGLGVGLQVPLHKLAELLRCHVATVKRAQELLLERRLIHRHAELVRVDRLTAKRRVKSRLRGFDHQPAAGRARRHEWANVTGVTFTTWRSLHLLRRRGHERDGVVAALWKTWGYVLARMAHRSEEKCAPKQRGFASQQALQNPHVCSSVVEQPNLWKTGPPVGGPSNLMTARGTRAELADELQGAAAARGRTGSEGDGSSRGEELRAWAARWARRTARI